VNHSDTTAIIHHLASIKNLQIDTLHTFCNINSGTYHLDGLARMHDCLNNAFKTIADTIQSIDFDPVPMTHINGNPMLQTIGKGLLIQKRPELKRRILLSGHMDTVYGPDHPFQTLRLIDENTLNGPGVADMKGGLLVLLNALEAFETLPIAHTVGWDVFINADEEIGSPASGPFLEKIASHYQAALVYEPAMDRQGTFAKNRKGSAKLTLIATGKSAHAGRAFNEGRNAIAYLAEALIAIHALNHENNGLITINIGKIAGGDALNVVPDKAVAQLDVRITRPEDESWVFERLNQIIHSLKRTDYTLTLQGGFCRPVKIINPETQRLFERIQMKGHALGLSLDWKDSGGCCDGNNLAKQDIPVIDTLGVRGGAIHSQDEFICLDSLTERTALSILILDDLAQGGLEELKR